MACPANAFEPEKHMDCTQSSASCFEYAFQLPQFHATRLETMLEGDNMAVSSRREFLGLAAEAALLAGTPASAGISAGAAPTIETVDGSPEPTRRVCDWLAGHASTNVPHRISERAKDLVLDGLGCALVGAQLPWSRTATEAIIGFDGAGDGMLIGWGRSIARSAAVLLNGTYIQSFELDDVHARAPLHSCSVILPALLGAAHPSTSGSDFLAAAVAGFEIGPRVGLSLRGPEMLSRGWHSGSVFGTHAAAAAAGVLLRLNSERMEDALGIAGTQSCGLMAAQYEAMCKRMHHGFAARAGYSAALLAQGGYTGIKQVFERDYGGFLAVYGEGHAPLPQELAKDLGSRWETLAISLKPYAAMGAAHGPLDSLAVIRARRPFKPDDIATIEIALSESHFSHGWWAAKRPLTAVGAQMHVGYALAVGILDGACLPAQFSPARLDADDVWALMPRISARHDPSFDRDAESQLQSTLTITFRDGTRETEHIAQSKTWANAMPRTDVIGKFRRLTKGIVDAGRAAAIEHFVLTLDQQSGLKPLLDLLAPAVRSPFDGLVNHS